MVVLAGAEAGYDELVVEWCTHMDRLIVADFYRRAYEQAAVDAKAAVIEAEEGRLAREARPAPRRSWRAAQLTSMLDNYTL